MLCHGVFLFKIKSKKEEGGKEDVKARKQHQQNERRIGE